MNISNDYQARRQEEWEKQYLKRQQICAVLGDSISNAWTNPDSSTFLVGRDTAEVDNFFRRVEFHITSFDDDSRCPEPDVMWHQLQARTNSVLLTKCFEETKDASIAAAKLITLFAPAVGDQPAVAGTGSRADRLRALVKHMKEVVMKTLTSSVSISIEQFDLIGKSSDTSSYKSPAEIFTRVIELAKRCGGKKTDEHIIAKVILLLNRLQPAIFHTTYGEMGPLGSEAIKAAQPNIMSIADPKYNLQACQTFAQTLYDNRASAMHNKVAWYSKDRGAGDNQQQGYRSDDEGYEGTSRERQQRPRPNRRPLPLHALWPTTGPSYLSADYGRGAAAPYPLHQDLLGRHSGPQCYIRAALVGCA